jgi:hypothetical protein
MSEYRVGSRVMISTGECQWTQRKYRSSATLSTTSHKGTDQHVSTGLYGEETAPNRLSYGSVPNTKVAC